MFRIVLTVSIGLCIVNAINPCINAPVLHDLPRRYVSYKADTASNEPYVCDALAIPLEGKWYKTNKINMPTTSPLLFGCGTKHPIWLNGNLPGAINNPVDRKACVVGLTDACVEEIAIKIQKCGVDDYVYFLNPTTTCESSYCFGDGKQDTPPDVDTGEITVERYWDHTNIPTLPNGYVERFRFECKFQTAQELDIFYQVMWYIDDLVHVSKTVKKENVADAVLKENTDFVKMGINIKCSVRPKNELDSTPGTLKISTSQYYGLRLDSEIINFPRSEIGHIKVQLTVPFGCIYVDNIRQKCAITIGMLHKDIKNEDCKANGDVVGEERFCFYTIDINDWDKMHEIPVKWQDGADYKITSTEHIMQLKVQGSEGFEIWDRHTDMPPIKVKVHDTTEGVLTKQCRIVNDPHMRTFDERYYEHHLTGVFTLYKDLTNPTYEVQHQTFNCNSGYHCTCGMAIRAGADVFVINYCGVKKIISFVTCHEKKLHVSKENARKYMVRMPSGTLIEIHISSSTSLAAFINPSVHDWRNSRGLCGFISNNCPDDFTKPDGTKVTIPGVNDACSASRIEQAGDFIKSWQVFGANNWFTLMENDNVPPSITTTAYCTCPHPHEDDIDGHFHCGGATVDCAIAFDNVGAAQCNLLFNNQRRKRSLEYPFKTTEMKKKRKRRDVLPAEIKVNMTPEQARQYCDEFLRSSPAFDACSDIPEVNTEEYIDICALDIKLTSTLSWANQTMADLKTSCMKELRMNNTLKEPGPEGEPSVASIVKNKICDGNPPCSNNGDCVNGTCSCYDGFISPDCSVDLNIPPELIGVRGDSLCDISEIPCNLSFVIAEEIYSTEMLSCEIVEYQVSANGTYIKMDNHIAVAKHETLVEVLCPLSTGRVKRSASSKDEENFSTAFEISVSYDGVLFSEPVDMLIYDSRCQEVVNTTERIHLRLMDGFCRLDGQCFMEDEYSTINPCMKCNTKVSQYMWTKVNDIDGCVQIETKNPKEVQTIVLATCIPIVSVLIIAVIIGLIKYKKLKRLKVGNSQDFGNICTTRNMPYKK